MRTSQSRRSQKFLTGGCFFHRGNHCVTISSRLMSRATGSRHCRQRLLWSVVERSCCLSATTCSTQERREDQMFGAFEGYGFYAPIFTAGCALAGTLDSRGSVRRDQPGDDHHSGHQHDRQAMVSSQRRAWRRALRPCGDERLSASRPARPPSVRSIAPPWRKGRLNGLRSSLVLMAQIDAIVVNFGRCN
jgi:hypothetical protein